MPKADEKLEAEDKGRVRKHQRILQEISEEEESAAPDISLDWMEHNLERPLPTMHGRWRDLVTIF